MNFTIRKAIRKDAPEIMRLIQQLADFENEPDAVEITVKDIEEDGFGTAPKFQCFIAENEEEVLGMALVYFRYSTWKGNALHLEDLIVDKKFRGKGVGAKLLEEVIKYGDSLQVKRIGWEVLDWNTNAIAFYKKIGAEILDDWQVVQLNASGIKNYMNKL